MKKFLKIILNIGIVIVSIAVIFCLKLAFGESLEMFPTEEQIEKQRIGYGFVTFVFLIIDIVLITIRVKLGKKNKEKNKEQNND